MPDTNALPRAQLSEVPLDDEPATDRAFLCEEDGRRYRVRVARADTAAAALPMAADDAPAPFLRGYLITVVALGDDGLPQRTGDGRVVIVGNTTWTVDARTLAAEHGLAPDAALALLVGNLIWQGSRVLAGEVALDQVMAGWGQAPVAPPAAPPVTFAEFVAAGAAG